MKRGTGGVVSFLDYMWDFRAQRVKCPGVRCQGRADG